MKNNIKLNKVIIKRESISASVENFFKELFFDFSDNIVFLRKPVENNLSQPNAYEMAVIHDDHTAAWIIPNIFCDASEGLYIRRKETRFFPLSEKTELPDYFITKIKNQLQKNTQKYRAKLTLKSQIPSGFKKMLEKICDLSNISICTNTGLLEQAKNTQAIFSIAFDNIEGEIVCNADLSYYHQVNEDTYISNPSLAIDKQIPDHLKDISEKFFINFQGLHTQFASAHFFGKCHVKQGCFSEKERDFISQISKKANIKLTFSDQCTDALSPLENNKILSIGVAKTAHLLTLNTSTAHIDFTESFPLSLYKHLAISSLSANIGVPKIVIFCLNRIQKVYQEMISKHPVILKITDNKIPSEFKQALQKEIKDLSLNINTIYIESTNPYSEYTDAELQIPGKTLSGKINTNALKIPASEREIPLFISNSIPDSSILHNAAIQLNRLEDFMIEKLDPREKNTYSELYPELNYFNLLGSQWTKNSKAPIAFFIGKDLPYFKKNLLPLFPDYRIAILRQCKPIVLPFIFQAIQLFLNRVENTEPCPISKKPAILLSFDNTTPQELINFSEKSNLPLYQLTNGFFEPFYFYTPDYPLYSVAFQSIHHLNPTDSFSDYGQFAEEYHHTEHSKTTEQVNNLIECLREWNIGPISTKPIFRTVDCLGIKISHRVLILGHTEESYSDEKGNTFTDIDLIQAIQQQHPHSEILYLPFVDNTGDPVISKESLKMISNTCTLINDHFAFSDLFNVVDQVYTISSPIGFYALVHHKPVTVFGRVFYAGWGLTEDKSDYSHRQKTLTLEELFYAHFIRSHRYIAYPVDPVGGILGTLFLHILEKRKYSEQAADTLEYTRDFWKILGSNYWPLFSEKIDTLSLTKQTNKVLLSNLPLILRRYPDSLLFKRAISYFLAGRFLINRNINEMLQSIHSILSEDDFYELVSTIFKYTRSKTAFIHIKKCYEATGNLEESLKAANIIAFDNDFFNNKEISLKLEDIKKSYTAILDIANLEKTRNNLKKSEEYLNLLLLSGITNDTVLLSLAELAYLQFDFYSCKFLSDFSQKINPGTLRSKKINQIIESAYLGFGKSKAIEMLISGLLYNINTTTHCLLNMSLYKILSGFNTSLFIDTLIYIFEKFVFIKNPDLYNPLIWTKTLTILNKPEKALCLLKENIPGSCNLQPPYILDLCALYRLTKELDKARMIVENGLTHFHTAPWITEALNIAYAQNDIVFLKWVHALSEKYGISLTPLTKRRMYLVQRDMYKAYSAFSTAPTLSKIKNFFKERFLPSLNELPSHTKTLAILSMWGPGDEISFASFYSTIHQKFPDIKLIITCDFRLQSLLERSYPEYRFTPVKRIRSAFELKKHGIENYIKTNNMGMYFVLDNTSMAQLDHADKVIPMSLLLGDLIKDYNSFPGKSFLIPDNKLVSLWKQRLSQYQDTMLVGICWRSSLTTYARNEHYFSIEDLFPLFELQGIQFICLQYDECDEEMAIVEKKYPGKFKKFDDLDMYDDFEGTAALMCSLDFVVSVATTVIQLSSALGCPSFLLSNSAEVSWRKREGTNIDVWSDNTAIIDSDPIGDKTAVISNLRNTLIEQLELRKNRSE